MAESVEVTSFAKINWALRVLWRRDDGYHELETLFQNVSLCDRLVIRRAGRTSLTCSDATIPTGEENLVIRAVRLLQQRYGIPEVAVRLTKTIPAGGGLGGGSSNAAATLLALRALFDLDVDDATLAGMALALGSDVPFFLVGGTAYARGRGELLERFEQVPSASLLLLLPEERMATPEAFRMLAARRSPGELRQPAGAGRFREAVARGLLRHPELLGNDLEEVVFERIPALAAFAGRLRDEGAAWSGMSGSGSTIVGAFGSRDERDRAARELAPLVRTATVEPVDHAVRVG